jgi:DnaJ-class molecular chaperone
MHTQMDVQTHEQPPHADRVTTMPGPPMKTCPLCLGSGRSDEYDFCHTCGGLGDVPRYSGDRK